MTVGDIVGQLQLKCEAGHQGLEKEVKGAYVGDLLSIVMAHAKEGFIWVTVQGHLNAVAVAVLVGVPAIILSQGIQPSEEMKAKAEEEQIALLITERSSYEVAKALSKWL